MALTEERTRIECFLPAGRIEEKKALRRITDYLHELHADTRLGMGGFTSSRIRPTVFLGWWWMRDGTIVADQIVLLVLDIRLRKDDPALERLVSKLRKYIFRIYDEKHSPQEEIWVTVQQLFREA